MMPREVAPGIFVATSPVYLTTTTVIAGPGGGCLLIDPALTVAELAGLGEWLASRGLHVEAAWSTHAHWDHVLWSASLGLDVPRYATPRAVAASNRDREAMIAAVTAEAPGHDLALFGRLRPLPAPGGAIPWSGPAARVVAHDAHSPGHAAIFLPDSGVLVAGDMLSDTEIPLLDLPAPPDAAHQAAATDAGDAAGHQAARTDAGQPTIAPASPAWPPDPFGDYRAGLGLLASLGALGVRRIVPGHGHVGDAAEFRARVAADFRYLDRVETDRDPADPRLDAPDAAWLRAEHARHRALAASGYSER